MNSALAASPDIGLTTAEAHARLKKFGPNAVREEEARPLRDFLKRFWAPIPWLLEASIILQLCIGETIEALVIALLLVVNAVLGFLQEGRAQRALALLRQQLRIQTRVRRDEQWVTLPAEELVPGDYIHLRQGSIVPADVKIAKGTLLADQSALTGESEAVPVGLTQVAYAGAMVRGGEAEGEIAATGTHTFFGKTAELVRTAGSANRQEHEIVNVVRNLFVINAGAVVMVIGYAHLHGMTLAYILPLLLTILLASIPVALPATFTLTAALGSVELSRRGVLVTRLSALHDIAAMTVICSDKTGTLTRNQATVQDLWTAPGFTELDLLGAAALASDPSGADPVDDAIIKAAEGRGWQDGKLTRLEFKPFDPTTKRAEALYQATGETERLRYVKGAPAVIGELAQVADSVWQPQAERLVARGQRVLAVAQGNEAGMRLVGLLGMEDAVREDSKRVVSAIGKAGVRVVMVTGDNALTAKSVAEQVGIPAVVCPPERLRSGLYADVMAHGLSPDETAGARGPSLVGRILAPVERALALLRGDHLRVKLVNPIALEQTVAAMPVPAASFEKRVQSEPVPTPHETGLRALPAHAAPEKHRTQPETTECSVFAGVLPEDKYKLVRAFQRHGAVVGMSGDGVNDAPALRQAEAGVAVANATDVAKAAAAIVLTQPGLGGVVEAIVASRRVFQRIITYTLNMLTKKIEVMALLVIGFLLTGHKPLTPMLMVLVLFLNDFLTMAISTDRMDVSPSPNHWNTHGILRAGMAFALGRLAFSLGVFLWGYYRLSLDMPHLQSLTFFTTILTSQAGVYLLRERQHFWHSPPSRFLLGSSVFGLGVTTLLCWNGLLVTAIRPLVLAAVAVAGLAYFFMLDWGKVWLFARLRVR